MRGPRTTCCGGSSGTSARAAGCRISAPAFADAFGPSYGAAFAVLLAHTKQQGGSKEVDSVELLELYAQLTQEAARRTMRFWRLREQADGGTPEQPSLSAASA